MKNILRYFNTRDVRATYTESKGHAVDRVQRGYFSVKGDPANDRFIQAIKDVKIDQIEAESDVHGYLGADSESYSSVRGFTSTLDFWKIETNVILTKAALAEKEAILYDSQVRSSQIHKIRNEIYDANPFVEKRNWIQKHIAWTRFSENKWIKGKNQEISTLQKQVDRNIKYDNKLSEVLVKAKEENIQIKHNNPELFAKAKTEYEFKERERISQLKTQETQREQQQVRQNSFARAAANASNLNKSQQPQNNQQPVVTQPNLGGGK